MSIKVNINSLKNKIILFFIVTGIIVTLLILLAYLANQHWIQDLYEEGMQQEQSSFEDKLVDKGKLSKAMITDYAVWDDTFEYVIGENPGYADENLVIPVLNSYEVDEVWLYDNGFNLVSSLSRQGEEDGLYGVKDEIKELLNENHTISFYFEASERVLEVYGSTIVKSIDDEHEGDTAGFMFVARVINEEFLDSLKDSEIIVVDLMDEKDSSYESMPSGSGVLSYEIEISDIKKNAIGRIFVQQDADYLEAFSVRTKIMLFSMMSLVILVLAASYVVAWSWVLKPVGAIYEGLEKKTAPSFEKITKEDSIFGVIARLISSTKENERSSQSELDDKKKLLESLEASNTEIEQTNAVMVGRELRMMEMKKEIAELKKKFGVMEDDCKKSISMFPMKDKKKDTDDG